MDRGRNCALLCLTLTLFFETVHSSVSHSLSFFLSFFLSFPILPLSLSHSHPPKQEDDLASGHARWQQLVVVIVEPQLPCATVPPGPHVTQLGHDDGEVVSTDGHASYPTEEHGQARTVGSGNACSFGRQSCWSWQQMRPRAQRLLQYAYWSCGGSVILSCVKSSQGD